jgi:hypothetical protein
VEQFSQWRDDIYSPLVFSGEPGHEQLKTRFMNKVMYIPRDSKASADNEKAVRMEMPTPELQEYHDFIGDWGTHKPFQVRFFAPPCGDRGVTRLFEKELKEDPLRDIVLPGDLISCKANLRTYTPQPPKNKEDKPTTEIKSGMKWEPEFRCIFIHHQGNATETAAILPNAPAAGFDYGIGSDASAFTAFR